MAKAHVTLANGTKVEIEGTPDEVRQLLEFYGDSGASSTDGAKKKKKCSSTAKRQETRTGSTKEQVDLSEIVNLVKSCDQAEDIESQILDRTSQVDRTLLPLFIVHEHLDNNHPLTSGDISKITTDLGIPIATANVSRTLSNTASKYVIGDKVRKQGQPVRYKLSRRGVQYLKKVLEDSSSDD